MNATVVPASTQRVSRLAPFLSGTQRFSRLWLVFVGACLLGGAVLRLTNLGKFGFWTDEYFHVFAAKSYLETGKMFVPMVGEYRRARLVTYITAGMFKLFGESEWSARFPFAAVNVVFIGIMGLVTRRLFSEVVSGACVFAMSFVPLAINMSRECRFYTLHQLFYFSAAMAFFAGFENISGRVSGGGRRRSMDWRWLAASGPMAGLALHFQSLTANLAVVVLCYLVAMAGFMGFRHGWLRTLMSKYVATLAIAAMAFVALYHLYPQFFQAKFREAVEIYDWQAAKKFDYNFYRFYLTDNFPALTFLFPVGAYVAIRRYGKAGLFALCSSAPLFFLHAFVYARKSERYIFYFFPFFLITSLIAIEPFLIWGWSNLRTALKGEPLRGKIVAAAFLLPGFLVFTYPWAINAVRTPFHSKNPDWKSLDDEFKRNLRSATVVTTNPREYIYYVGAYPTYYRTVELDSDYVYEPTLLKGDTDFRKALHQRGDVYFVGAEWNFNNDAFMTEAMRGAVTYSMSPVDHAGDRRILAYHADHGNFR